MIERQSGPRPTCLRVGELRPSEIRFVAAMQKLGYGSFESLRINAGELELDPWPTTIRSVKFASATTNQPGFEKGRFEPKKQVAELFALVRTIDVGIIRALEVRGGLPFSMEISSEQVSSDA